MVQEVQGCDMTESHSTASSAKQGPCKERLPLRAGRVQPFQGLSAGQVAGNWKGIWQLRTEIRSEWQERRFRDVVNGSPDNIWLVRPG